MKLTHTAVFTPVLVVSVLDDQADPLNISAVRLSVALWLPCWVWTLISVAIPGAWPWLCGYVRGWRDDLRAMWRAWVGDTAWSFGTG